MIRTPGAEPDPDRLRIQTSRLREDDDGEVRLRPRRLDEFVGQEALKAQLAISIRAAADRGEALDHVLLAGPPGLGKTSLARIVAEELGVPFVPTAGPALERKAEIAAFLTDLEPRSVFFVDEIHRLPRAVEETFYPAMEDGQLPITLGVGAGAKVVTLDIPAFTLIGATTRAGLLTTPLRDRFGIQHRLDHYVPDELAAIVVRSAGVLNVPVHLEGARAIAVRARGTPRVANRLLKRVRDFAEVHADGAIDAQTADAALDLLGVDHEGLDRTDREILSIVCERFGGGPVGLSTLAVAVQEEQDTIEDVYEPYLLQRGFLQRTPRGRCATPHAFRHLGLEPPKDAESLF
nr:Holliday junction branch migration DNA helicase RuvB [Candidatus Solirubrobacter pratensis]